MEIAQTYLGNINQDRDLAQSIARQTCLEVSLQDSDRRKGRIHARSNSGIAVGIIKGRDRTIQDGDLYRTNSQKLVLIHLQERELLVLDFSQVDRKSLAKLVSLGHTLGNHHYPIVVKDFKIYVQLVTDKSILEKLINSTQIPNLKYSYHPFSDRQLKFSKHTH